ncbi:hypothetical protein MUK42_18842 [Musa troglodytarum]|uniref:Uncharacterized protein n=1 Tax=Musa troglodytarum TaxID=320322 RepID=A0A9E7JJM8_9LILI|nr:hypothetical protein MUK42_18842 [Musa troglodytarum]
MMTTRRSTPSSSVSSCGTQTWLTLWSKTKSSKEEGLSSMESLKINKLELSGPSFYFGAEEEDIPHMMDYEDRNLIEASGKLKQACRRLEAIYMPVCLS